MIQVEKLFRPHLVDILQEKGMYYMSDCNLHTFQDVRGRVLIGVSARAGGELLGCSVPVPDYDLSSPIEVVNAVSETVKKAIDELHKEAVRLGIFAAVEQVNEAECERMMHL